jgi:hypothetical protein
MQAPRGVDAVLRLPLKFLLPISERGDGAGHNLKHLPWESTQWDFYIREREYVWKTFWWLSFILCDSGHFSETRMKVIAVNLKLTVDLTNLIR